MFIDFTGSAIVIFLIVFIPLVILSIISSIFLRKILLNKILKIKNQNIYVNVLYFLIFNAILITIFYFITPKLARWLLETFLVLKYWTAPTQTSSQIKNNLLDHAVLSLHFVPFGSLNKGYTVQPSARASPKFFFHFVPEKLRISAMLGEIYLCPPIND